MLSNTKIMIALELINIWTNWNLWKVKIFNIFVLYMQKISHKYLKVNILLMFMKIYELLIRRDLSKKKIIQTFYACVTFFNTKIICDIFFEIWFLKR